MRQSIIVIQLFFTEENQKIEVTHLLERLSGSNNDELLDIDFFFFFRISVMLFCTSYSSPSHCAFLSSDVIFLIFCCFLMGDFVIQWAAFMCGCGCISFSFLIFSFSFPHLLFLSFTSPFFSYFWHLLMVDFFIQWVACVCVYSYVKLLRFLPFPPPLFLSLASILVSLHHVFPPLLFLSPPLAPLHIS